MTKSEAVSFLRRYRRDVRISPLYIPWRKNDYVIQKYAYMRYVIGLLIEKIRNSNENPIAVVHKAYWNSDMFMMESDNVYTHKFLKIVTECLGDILVDLRYEDEKQKHCFLGENLVARYLGIGGKGKYDDEEI